LITNLVSPKITGGTGWVVRYARVSGALGVSVEVCAWEIGWHF
jgi:hypothetical protein